MIGMLGLQKSKIAKEHLEPDSPSLASLGSLLSVFHALVVFVVLLSTISEACWAGFLFSAEGEAAYEQRRVDLATFRAVPASTW